MDGVIGGIFRVFSFYMSVFLEVMWFFRILVIMCRIVFIFLLVKYVWVWKIVVLGIIRREE